jgi:CsoR family transcriptional regulator, copper-sensing transcriptional repressor
MDQELKESREVLLKRLKRIEGQIRGIQKMIEEERDCVSLIVQLAAVRSGIEGAGAMVLNNYMKLCFKKGPGAEADMKSLARAISVWGRVRGGDLSPEIKSAAAKKPEAA